jgi:hypothetical protein
LLLTGLVSKLWVFKRLYGLQPAVAEAVHGELPGLLRAKFPDRLASYNKALRLRTIVPLDGTLLADACGEKGPIVYAAIESLGDKLWNQGIGRGEAYTHAAGILLKIPIVTNDMQAIRCLRLAQVGAADRILRFYDLVVFFFQIAELTESECDSIRTQLVSRGEHIPACFRGRPFSDGLTEFFPRLLDTSREAVGCRMPHDSQLDQTTYIFKQRPI